MEDLEGAPGSPALQNGEEPQGLNDPRDPLNPGIEEEDRPNAPLGDPTADVDAFEDEEAPETVGAMEDAVEEDEDAAANASTPGGDDDDDNLDDESELEELDETQFQDFDPSALNIPSKPLAVDESNVGLIGVHKRKRTEEEERERERKKKKKREGRREKPKRRKQRDEEDNFEGGEEIEGKRARKGKVGAEGRPKRREETPEEDLENLSPEERESFAVIVIVRLNYADCHLQAAAALWTRRWTKQFARTNPTAVVRAATSTLTKPTTRSSRCGTGWPGLANWMPTRAPKAKSRRTNSPSCPQSSSL